MDSPEDILERAGVQHLPLSNAHMLTRDPAGWRDDAPPIEAEAREKPAEFKSAFDFCSAYEPISYAIEPFVRSGSLYTLTARTGAGKTALLITMALAVSSGRGDKILGREVTKGRVAFIAVENPDDLRMRIMVAAYILNIDLREIADNLIILDKRVKPEALAARLKSLSADDEFTLIMVDTLAAYYDGDDINNNVQAGDFMRRLGVPVGVGVLALRLPPSGSMPLSTVARRSACLMRASASVMAG